MVLRCCNSNYIHWLYIDSLSLSQVRVILIEVIMKYNVKVVCIDDGGFQGYLTVGNVYETNDPFISKLRICKADDNSLDLLFDRMRFLQLPDKPKTCVEMTMEQYLAMVCLRYSHPSYIVDGNNEELVSREMPLKYSDHIKYCVKTEKSQKELAIERIESEILKLTQDLAELNNH